MAGFGYLQTANFAFSSFHRDFRPPGWQCACDDMSESRQNWTPPKAQTRLESTPSRSGSMAVAGEPGIRWSVFPVVLRVLP